MTVSPQDRLHLVKSFGMPYSGWTKTRPRSIKRYSGLTYIPSTMKEQQEADVII